MTKNTDEGMNETQLQELFDGFVPWLKTKPADETFEYGDQSNCVFAQYLKSLGYSDPMVGGYSFDFQHVLRGIDDYPTYIFPIGWAGAILDFGPIEDGEEDRTFGGVWHRIERLSDPEYMEVCMELEQTACDPRVAERASRLFFSATS